MPGRWLVPILALVAGANSSPAAGAAQSVHVYPANPSWNGSTPLGSVTANDQNQKVLVIPVVSQSTAFDPANNPLDPVLLANFRASFQTVSAFWSENSYGRVSFQTTVLERFYQMPMPIGHYFNPDFVAAKLAGSSIGADPVTVPAGTFRLKLHISDADESTILVDLAAGTVTLAALRTAIEAELGLGDKLAVALLGAGANARLEFTVGQTYVSAGTYVHLEPAGSDQALLDAIGLDRPTTVLSPAPVQITTGGAAFLVTTLAGETITLVLTNDAATTETWVWTPGAATFATNAAFVAAVGAAAANATISAAAGGQLAFAITPTIGGNIMKAEFTGPTALLDGLGLNASTEADAVINFSARNTVRGDRRLILGQAVAAFVLNELTVIHATPSATGAIPNLAITAANKAAIDQVMQDHVDPFNAVAVVFLDAPNKRAGAAGGYLSVGIDNGGFLYEYQTHASGQVAFDFTSAQTFSHETGHNIGFADLYNNSSGSYDPSLRYPEDWDVMHSSSLMPHTGIWHKEILAGWLTNSMAPIGTVAVPANFGDVLTGSFVVTPLEVSQAEYDALLAPVAGRQTVKGLRLPLGLGGAGNDHYLLVHNRQKGRVFSEFLPQKTGAPTRGGLYLTDAISTGTINGFHPTTRNYDHPLTDVPLVAGNNVSPVRDNAPAIDVDFLQTYPAYDGLTIDIVGEVAGPGVLNDRPSYLVDVRREQRNFLDLRITPWGAPPYESPDIWIERADGSLSATPLAGNGEPVRWSTTYDPAANGGQPLNWIRVQVTNGGNVGATAVQVQVKINTPGGMGDDGTWVTLPLSGGRDIPAGGTAIFDFPWTPRVNRHTCIKAEVYRWTSALGDLDPWNNGTQENVTDFYPTASSPWEVTPIEFEVASRLPHAVDVEIEPQFLPRGFIVTVDKPFFTIPARSKVLVTGTLRLDENVIPIPGAAPSRDPKRRGGIFHLAAFVVAGDYRQLLGGISYRVFPSARTDLNIAVSAGPAGEIVVTGTSNPGVPNGHFEIEIRYPSGRYQWVDVTSDGSGNVNVTIPPLEQGTVRVTVHYPPGGDFAPTTTDETLVDTKVPGSGAGAGAGVGTREVSFYLGGRFSSRQLPLRSGFTTGFRLGRRLAAPWAVELETGIVFTDSVAAQGLLGHAIGQLRWFPVATPQPLRGFLSAGAGATWFRSTGTWSWSPVVTFGAGIEARWHPRVGFRLDVRDFYTTDLFSTGGRHNLDLTWGVAWWF